MTPLQTTLWPTSPLVRSTDPQTSRDAAATLDLRAGQAKVYAALSRLGEATDAELREAPETADLGYGSASKRRCELERAGLVERCGERDGRLVFRVAT